MEAGTMLKNTLCIGLFSLLGIALVSALILHAHEPLRVEHVLTGPPEKSTRPLLSRTLQETTLYFWDFEDGDGGFTAEDFGDVGTKWQTTDEYWTHDGSKAWWCGERRENIWGYGDFWSQTLDMAESIDLSGTSEPLLSFDARWRMECSGDSSLECRESYEECFINGILQADWDGLVVYISTDGGTTFPPEQYLLPTDLTHICVCGTLWSHQVAAGYFVTGGIKGLNGDSQGWVHLEYPLHDYKIENIVIRFHFCSDAALSTFSDFRPAYQDTTLHGFFLDNISVDDDGSNIFFDDADDEVFMVPGYTFRNNNIWQYVDNATEGPSPSHAWVGDGDNERSMKSVWLESPWFELPEGWYPELRYWFKCDMPDFDGNHNRILDDFYDVKISADGNVWSKLIHHWAREPEGFSDTTGYTSDCHFETWWGYMHDDLTYNGRLTLNDYVGQTVKIYWRTVSDADDDCGNGTGLWLDNIEIVALPLQSECDFAVTNMAISNPVSVNYITPVQVAVTNLNPYDIALGDAYLDILDQGGESLTGDNPWLMNRLFPDPHFLFPPDETLYAYQHDWQPTETGEYYLRVFIDFDCDTNATNDTLTIGPITVSESGTGYLGYFDLYSAEVDTVPPEPDAGPAVRFSIPDDMSGARLQTVRMGIAFDYPSLPPSNGIGISIPQNRTGSAFSLMLFLFGPGENDSTFGDPLIEPFEWYPDSLDENGRIVIDLTGRPDYENLQDFPADFWVHVRATEETEADFLARPLVPDMSFHRNWIFYAEGQPRGHPGVRGHSCGEGEMVRYKKGWEEIIGITFSPSWSEGQRGDVNADGSINVLDVIGVINHILDTIEITELDALWRADCNGDEAINVLDALGIVNVILGISECEP